MGDSKDIPKIVAELSRTWVGKCGVWAIFDRHQGPEKKITFLVENLDKNRRKLPTHYKGINIDYEETNGIASY